jgi:FlaA1/EpsC-like NDP-sugar epimerase
LISLSGLKPYQDIKIVETGIRPGEKLAEELRFESEETVPTSHPKIFIAKIARLDAAVVDFALLRLAQLVHERDDTSLRDFLSELIPDSQLNGVITEGVTNGLRAAAHGSP